MEAVNGRPKLSRPVRVVTRSPGGHGDLVLPLLDSLDILLPL